MKKVKSYLPIAMMLSILLIGSWMVKPVDLVVPDLNIRFNDVSADVACVNVHSKVQLASEFDNIMPWLSSVGAAAAAADFDNDGLQDFYVTNSGRDSFNRLFRNRGDGRFEDVAAIAGVHDCNRQGASMDALFVDYDNDGDQDLYVVKWAAPNIFFENNGDGSFSDATEQTGLGYWGYANGVVAFDYNRDGLPDIMIANYFAEKVRDASTGQMLRNDLWNPVSTEVMHSTFTHADNGGRNILYHNNGDGSFRDVSLDVGLGHTGWSLDIGSGDLNNDGWPDLYIANDFGADELYFNTGATEFPPRFKMAVDGDGHPGIGNDWWKGMNVDIADVNADGRLDIYVTNILARRYKTDEGNMLWLNSPDAAMPGNSKFNNISEDVGTYDGGWGWAGKFCDFNNDGLMDIFTVNGFATGTDRDNTYWFALQEMVTQTKNNASDTRVWPPMGDRDLSGHEPNRLFIQLPGTGKDLNFVEYALSSGITDLYNGRGIALADYDNDGDIDMYLANQDAPNCLYKNESDLQHSNWIGFELRGNPDAALQINGQSFRSSRDALGARIEIFTAGVLQVREQNTVNGFASQSERRLHFGLGARSAIDSVVVKWPSGRVASFAGADAFAINKYHTIEESL